MMLRQPVRLLALAGAVTLAACSTETPSPTPSPTGTPTAAPSTGVLPGGTFGELTFDDEFAGPEIDTTRWSVEDGHQNYWPDSPWRRNFKKENVYIEDGALVIRVAKEQVGFSSGAIGTGDKGQPAPFEQAFGRFEARMRFPTQQGHGYAFWLWNVSQGHVDGTGGDGAEIDILERWWLIDRGIHALHWDGYGSEQGSAVQTVNGLGLNDGGWHVARLDWYPDKYVFFVDGRETWRTSAGGVDQTPNFVLFSDEIANYGTGPEAMGVGPIEDAVLPDYTHVDYVRVYAYVPPT
jgi:beta-glucanase (GH16 family)